jgi:DNA-binding transcriptional LysR family regulator
VTLRGVPVNPWLGVEFRHLAALIAIARTGSFRGAADDLGYVQSAISQQLARLETLVGIRLVDRERGTGPVELTDAGSLLLEHANAIVERLDAAQADLRSLAEGAAGTLRVGVFEGIARSLMPGILRGRHGHVPFVPSELLDEAEAFELIARGSLDVAVAGLPLHAGPFASVELCVDPCVLLVHEESELASAVLPPSLTEIAGLPLIRHDRWRMMDLIEAELRAAGGEPRFRLHAQTSAAVQAYVAEGLGAALMPSLSALGHPPGTTAIELAGQLPPTTLTAFWNRERQPNQHLTEFIRLALKTCARLRADRFPESEQRGEVPLAA